VNLQDFVSATRVSVRNPEILINIFDLLYSSQALNFDMQAQTQSNWCWAATATSVSHFYWPWSGWTQCSVANGELGRGDCCNSPVPSPCNVPWYLDRALTRTDNFVSITGPVDYQTVRTEIAAGRPVGARIGWSGGGGHFMVIYGCGRAAGIEYFNIDDPIYGKSEPTVSTFSAAYQGTGSWTHTYFTKRAIVIKFRPYLIPEIVLKRIWEMRPLLRLRQPGMVAERQESALNLAMPHPVFSLGLDQLREARLPETPVHLRVMEVSGEKPQAFYDVDLGESASVRSVAGPNPYLDLFQRGVQEILKTTERWETEAELRLLQIPALYVDALWLHFDDSERDQFLPVRAPFGPAPFRLYPARQFMEEVSAKARERQTGDDLIAP
jgi:hypothetical protein